MGPSPSPKEHRAVFKPRLSLVLAAAVLPLAGCGGSGSSGGDTGADPAKVVPAAAPVYAEAVVRPDGDVRDGARDALRKLLRTDDPAKKLVALFDKAAADSGVTWDELEQWLGPRVGVYLSGVVDGKPVGAVVADTTDTGKARSTLDKLKAKAGSDTATAIVGDYAVFGSPDGVRAVQQTAGGGRPLSDVADFKASRDGVAADDALGMAYVAPQRLLDLLAKMQRSGGSSALGDRQTIAVLRQLMAKAGRVAAVSLHADGSAVRVDGASIGAPAGKSGTAAADALAALPADAWLGIGLGDLGTTLTRGLAQLQQLSSVAGSEGAKLDIDGILRRFEARTGIDIRRDFLSWMGDGVLYARGHSIADIGVVLSVASKDPAGSRKAVGTVAQGLAKAGMNVRSAKIDGYDVAVEVRSAAAPISFFVAANGERFSVGINPQAMSDVLEPSSELGDSQTYADATKALGGDVEPVMILDTPTIVSLVESFGIGQAHGYDKVKPYLDVLGPISAGTAHDGDLSRFAFALGLK
jgi:hypothetical protein